MPYVVVLLRIVFVGFVLQGAKLGNEFGNLYLLGFELLPCVVVLRCFSYLSNNPEVARKAYFIESPVSWFEEGCRIIPDHTV